MRYGISKEKCTLSFIILGTFLILFVLSIVTCVKAYKTLKEIDCVYYSDTKTTTEQESFNP